MHVNFLHILLHWHTSEARSKDWPRCSECIWEVRKRTWEIKCWSPAFRFNKATILSVGKVKQGIGFLLTWAQHAQGELLWSVIVRRPSVNNYLKKSSSLKPANRFQWNFTEMILGWCTFRKHQRYEFCEELWLPRQPKEKTLKIFLSQTVRARAFIFGM